MYLSLQDTYVPMEILGAFRGLRGCWCVHTVLGRLQIHFEKTITEFNNESKNDLDFFE